MFAEREMKNAKSEGRRVNASWCTVLILVFLNSVTGQEIPLTITDNGYIFVDVVLNDTAKSRFLLDTGAGITVVSDKVFQRVKSSLAPGGHFTGFRHDGDRLDGEYHFLPSLSVGSLKHERVPMGVYPPLDTYGIDGLVSMKTFEDRPFTIDFRNKRLILETVESLKARTERSDVLPLLLNTERDLMLDIFVRICLNDSVTLEAELDTGSGYDTFLVNPYYIKRLGLDTTGARSRPYKTPISGQTLRDYILRIPSVAFCGSSGLRVTEQNAIFRQNLIYEGLIGSGFFKDKEVTIDIPGRKLMVLREE